MSGIILFIIVGVVAGFLAGLIVKGGGFGFLWNLIVGVIGGLLGGWLLGGVHLFGSAILNQILTATLGAIILLLVLSLFNKKKR